MRSRAVIKQLICPQCHQAEKAVLWEPIVYPPCSRCGHPLEDHLLRRVDGVVPDDIPGGLVMEHVEPGRKVYSRTELNAVLAKHNYRVSDYGWTGEAETVYTKSQRWADLRTKEQRQREMADFLGMDFERYQQEFP